MKGSFKIATLFGIPIHIHWSFLLIFVYIYFVSYFSNSPASQTIRYMLLMIGLFVCVVFHEFGHALTARRFGVGTHDIILSPIGGIARLDRLPEKPLQEFLVAIAGPAVNIVIAILLIPFYLYGISSLDRYNLFNGLLNSSGNHFIPELSLISFLIVGLFWLNIVLAVFNLLPAFPMDGGRVLRALLSIRFPRVRATRIASVIGQGFAVLFILYGLFGTPTNFLYVFIGIFVFMTASNEFKMVKVEHVLQNHKVREIAYDNFLRLFPNDQMQKPIQELQRMPGQSFLILDQWENLIGLLSEKEILRAYKQEEAERLVTEYAEPAVLLIDQEATLSEAYSMLQKNDTDTLIVIDARTGTVRGVLNPQMLNNYLRFQQKLWKQR